MLFFLFPPTSCAIFDRLGYESHRARAAHGRLLRPAHLARLDAESRRARRGAAGIDPESSWERFLVALESDVGDLQGGTTKEGIHMGVMAGTLDLVQRDYVGARIYDGCADVPAAAAPPPRRGVVLHEVSGYPAASADLR